MLPWTYQSHPFGFVHRLTASDIPPPAHPPPAHTPSYRCKNNMSSIPLPPIPAPEVYSKVGCSGAQSPGGMQRDTSPKVCSTQPIYHGTLSSTCWDPDVLWHFFCSLFVFSLQGGWQRASPGTQPHSCDNGERVPDLHIWAVSMLVNIITHTFTRSWAG